MYFLNLKQAIADLKSGKLDKALTFNYFIAWNILLILPLYVLYSPKFSAIMIYDDISLISSAISILVFYITTSTLYKKYGKNNNFLLNFFVLNFIATVFNLIYIILTSIGLNIFYSFKPYSIINNPSLIDTYIYELPSSLVFVIGLLLWATILTLSFKKLYR